MTGFSSILWENTVEKKNLIWSLYNVVDKILLFEGNIFEDMPIELSHLTKTNIFTKENQ